MPDRDLVEAVLDGNNRAMHELYTSHHRRIYGLALRLTGNIGDAEDVVQETFLRAWRNLKRFRGDSSFGTWLYRIAVNLCRDLGRKRRPTEPEKNGVSTATPGDPLARKQLEAALAGLPHGYREIVVLHDVLELGHGEIAEVLEIAVGTSKSQLHKARAQLRKTLRRSA
jgi:RNA polymerase sigma-70 factor (ECF subfamily)